MPLRVLGATVFGAAGAALTTLTIEKEISEHLMAIVILALALATVIAAAARMLVAKLLHKRDEWASKGQHPIWRTALAIASLWPLLLLVPPLLLLGDRHNNLNVLSVLILLLEVGALLLALTWRAILLLRKAWRHAPRTLTWLTVAVAVGGGVAGWFTGEWIEPFADPFKRAAMSAITGVGATLVAVGIVLLTSRTEVALHKIGSALRNRDGVQTNAERGRDILRTMAVAAIPGISELAEATNPPFHKSFMIVEPRFDESRTTEIVFEVFAVDDERTPEVAHHPALPNPPGVGATSRGSYLVDRLTLKLQ